MRLRTWRALLAAGVVGLCAAAEPQPAPRDDRPPYQRELQGKDAERADALQKQVDQFESFSLFAGAVKPAGELAALRRAKQGADHWQTRDAERQLKYERLVAALPAAAILELQAADRAAYAALEARKKGRYAEAEALLRKGLLAKRKHLGDADGLTLVFYNNLADALDEQGKFAEARTFYERTAALSAEAFGPEHPDTASALSNLATCLGSQGDLGEELRLFQQVLAMRLRLRGERHPEVALVYHNLADNCFNRGDVKAAVAFARKALALRQELLPPDDPDIADTRKLLGVVLLREPGGQLEAEPLFREALATYRKSLGDGHPKTASAEKNLATSILSRGAYAEARPHLERALAVRRAVLGEEHPETAGAYSTLAVVDYALGHYAEAEENLVRAARGHEYGRVQSGLSGMERAAFSAAGSPLSHLAALLARRGAAGDAWRRLEEGLGRGLLDELTRPVPPAEQERERRLQWEVHRLDGQAESLLTPEEGKPPGEDRRRAAAALAKRRQEARTRLSDLQAELIRKYGAPAGEVYDLAKIQSAIPPEAALVAWVDAEGLRKAVDRDGDHWGCVVRQRGEPAWVRLPPPRPGEHWTPADVRLASEVRRLLADESDLTGRWREKATEMARLRLEPLRPLLAASDDLPAVRHLVVLPSDALRGVPVEALVEAWPDAPPLTVSYAPSGTLFAWLRERSAAAAGSPAARPLLAVGDPDYRPAVPNAGPGPRRAAYAPLPNSAREVEQIAALFPAYEKLLKKDASEQRLGELAASGGLTGFGVLHFATHGVADAGSPLRSALVLSDEGLPDPAEQMLAGREPTTGRLTAERILRTWKLDADLVTLSACDSGLGRFAGGEGYLGFAQALFPAGARSLLLSQWKVDDRATALLMTRFYQNLTGRWGGLPGPLPKAIALAEARRWLRDLTAEEAERLNAGSAAGGTRGDGSEKVTIAPGVVHPYEHPRFWAAFTLVGDPGDVSVPLPDESPPVAAAASPAGWWPSAPWLGGGVLAAAGLALACRRGARRRDSKVQDG